MTARMPRRRNPVRMARDAHALSAMTVSGLRRGRPADRRGTRIASSTVSNTVESLTWPGVTTMAKGRPRPSAARWTLVVNPPRDLPSALARRRMWRIFQFVLSRCPFCGARGVLVSTVDGGVHRHGPLHRTHRVILDLHVLQQLRPSSVHLPAGEAFVDGLPGAITLGQVTPGCPGPQPPEHTVHHLAVVPPGPPTTINTRQQRAYPLPRHIRQLTPANHKSNDQVWLVTHEPQVAAWRRRTHFKELGKVEQSRLLLVVRTPLCQGDGFLAGDLSFLFVEQRVTVRIHPAEFARAMPVEGAQHPRQRFTGGVPAGRTGGNEAGGRCCRVGAGGCTARLTERSGPPHAERGP